MAVYRLNKELVFPNPELANEDGLLAVGGDLSPQRILFAYCNGIFPWFSEGDPILWWSPDPRMILYPADINISRSMGKFLRKGLYSVSIDTCFREVMSLCGSTRHGDTWITADMLGGYCRLFDLGFAHSVEVWFEGRLVGGLYGVSLGRCFFGESMFSLMDNASKTALVVLAELLLERGFLFIDCQVYSEHLASMGAVNIPRSEFLRQLEAGVQYETIRGSWTSFLGGSL